MLRMKSRKNSIAIIIIVIINQQNQFIIINQCVRVILDLSVLFLKTLLVGIVRNTVQPIPAKAGQYPSIRVPMPGANKNRRRARW